MQLPMLAKGESTDIERMIGGHIADLIEDGATLQLGIGGIPNTIASFPDPKRPGTAHGNVCGRDGGSFHAGIVTNRRKTCPPAKWLQHSRWAPEFIRFHQPQPPMLKSWAGKYVKRPRCGRSELPHDQRQHRHPGGYPGAGMLQSLGVRQFSGMVVRQIPTAARRCPTAGAASSRCVPPLKTAPFPPSYRR